MSQIRRQLKRYENLNQARYLTCSCYHRLPLFNNNEIKDKFVEHLTLTQGVMAFDLYAWVIMPEHFHILLRPAMGACGSEAQTVTQVLRRLKSSFAKQIIDRWHELNAPILQQLTDSQDAIRFWQAGGGYDRNIFTCEELLEKVAYIHQNPVRRGLVADASEYRWSSSRHYEGASYDGPSIARLP